MEELIYIVLIVVWLLVSFLKRKPKKGTQPARQQPSAQDEDAVPVEEMEMEDVLEEFFGGGKKKKEKTDSTSGEPVYETRERADRPERDEGYRRDERGMERESTIWDRESASRERESAGREDESPVREQYDSRDESLRKGYEKYEGASAEASEIEDKSPSVDKARTIEELIRSHKKEEAMRQAREEEETGGVKSEEVPDFDLRQAVIFSEILNRKYN